MDESKLILLFNKLKKEIRESSEDYRKIITDKIDEILKSTDEKISK